MRFLAFALALSCSGLAACGRVGSRDGATDAAVDAPPWGAAEAAPAARTGMVWIPAGILLVGTPPDRVPRIADEEMAGEQLVMSGYYIDVYPYPNEAGAIPTSNLSQADAEAICAGQQKRLCAEIELERACKGPKNTTYEYGDTYDPAACGTGTTRTLVPNGVNAACVSEFGVHDLHGSVWTWSSSEWGRGSAKAGSLAVRGGNGPRGELVARCAHGRAEDATSKGHDVGVRCCAGEKNTFAVKLDIKRADPLKWDPPDPVTAAVLANLLPEELGPRSKTLRREQTMVVERRWVWHPLGNEELVVAGGCAHLGRQPSCGVAVIRMGPQGSERLEYIASDLWQPILSESGNARELFVNGGDINGAFRRKLSYDWGRIGLGPKERKHRHPGSAKPSYD